MRMFKSVEATDSTAEVVYDEKPASRFGPRSLSLIAILVVLALGWFLLRPAQAPAAAPPVPVVTIATPLTRQIAQWDEFIGRFEASQAVEVRARVPGQITAIHFTDGQYVRKGAPLFTLDARPYRAALAEAQASVATANAAVDLARSNLSRAQRLISDDAVAKTEIDRLVAEVKSGEAALAAARAQVRSRALDVEFATVRAPISGRISDRRVDAGNLVSAGNGEGGTLLTTINAIDPIYFSFDGSEGAFLASKRNAQGNGAQVDVRLQDEGDYSWHGKLDFTDNGLDPRSGTIRARAVIANPKGFLTPGMFGNMRLSTGDDIEALLIPDTAIQTDQTRKLVMVVDKSGTVAAREVELGPLVQGLRVIRKGLTAADQVVIEGNQSAMPGGKVRPHTGRIAGPTGPQDTGAAANRPAPAGSATLSN